MEGFKCIECGKPINCVSMMWNNDFIHYECLKVVKAKAKKEEDKELLKVS